MKDHFIPTEIESLYTKIPAESVHEILSQKMLVDGFDLVLDLVNSKGLTIVDKRSGDKYLDFFSFFASSPIGMNHQKISNKEFREKIGFAAQFKPSNSDVYTALMAEFVDTFNRIAVPDEFKHLFFIAGGSLAVENALKVAFDWKIKKNFQKGYKEEKGTKIIHFKEAFHGRSGYTLSLTNTDPNKVAFFPKFNWPRISNPKVIFPLEKNLELVIESEIQAITEIQSAINNNKDDIAAIIIEPVQGEGGDNFFRKEFFERLRKISDDNEVLLIFDEVQTGLGLTGKTWAYQHFVQPDIIAFGKKMQVCGIMSTGRIDDIPDNCFKKSGRINSTWGGNLVDMVRSQKYLEIIADENLVENASDVGEYLLARLHELEIEFPQFVTQSRGLGLMCAFNLPDNETRNQFIKNCYKNKLLILGCGQNSVRFRPPLDVRKENIDQALQIIRNVLFSLVIKN